MLRNHYLLRSVWQLSRCHLRNKTAYELPAEVYRYAWRFERCHSSNPFIAELFCPSQFQIQVNALLHLKDNGFNPAAAYYHD